MGIGRYRDIDGEHAIDASGEIVNPGGVNVEFDGVEELGELLAEDPLVSIVMFSNGLPLGLEWVTCQMTPLHVLLIML